MKRPRDAVVTGLGFCLPGDSEPVFTAGQVWDIASHGRSVLVQRDIAYGAVNLTPEHFGERLPEIPEFFSRHYTDAHRFGLVSLVEACADAELDLQAGDLSEAALLVGRGGVDSNVGVYLSLLNTQSDEATALDGVEMFVAAALGATPSDVAVVQAAAARSTGPCFTVTCGCSLIECRQAVGGDHQPLVRRERVGGADLAVTPVGEREVDVGERFDRARLHGSSYAALAYSTPFSNNRKPRCEGPPPPRRWWGC